MKNWITLVAIAISFALVAQPGKGNKGHGGDKGKQGVKMHPGSNKGFKIPNQKGGKIKPGKHNGYKMPKQKGNSHMGKGNSKHYSKHHYEKGHANFIYMYSYSPFIYPTRNYGQWRSQEAKKKHKAYPMVLELNVLNGVLMIQERNAFVLVEVDHKIERYHTLVIARHKAGLITDAQFSIHLGNVKKMKKKRGYYDY